MKESATIACEWVKAHHAELGIDPERFEKNDINIHVPEGAIPKDGPSAGITMVTSIVSTYTGRKVKERIAMTAEPPLQTQFVEGLVFHYVRTNDEVLALALE